MNSEEILKTLVGLTYEYHRNEVCGTLDYDHWCKDFEKVEKQVFANMHEATGWRGELKPDARRKLMHDYFVRVVTAGPEQQVPWQRDYVRRRYSFSPRGRDLVYYPAVNAKRLVVGFSSMGKDRFDRYSRYWDVTERWRGETAYLFFKDDSYCYYLGSDQSAAQNDYFQLIRFFMAVLNLGGANVYTVGSSMGGYAAIFYACVLGLRGCVVASPQTTKRAAMAHKYRNWEKHIAATGNQWVDLDLLFHRCDVLPHIYIEHGRYAADRLAAEALVAAMQGRSSMLVLRTTDWLEHTHDSLLSLGAVESAIQFFENIPPSFSRNAGVD